MSDLERDIDGEAGGHSSQHVVHIVAPNEWCDDSEVTNGCPHSDLALPNAQHNLLSVHVG